MTPEQEERLGQMMRDHARKGGHTKKTPTETVKGIGQGTGLSDYNIIAQIILYMRQTDVPVTRVEIIANINAGATRIRRIIHRMHEAGTIQRLSTSQVPLWELTQK